MVVDETETSPLPFTPPVRIRLYRDARAWHYLREILFYRDLEGNINLHELKSELAVDGQLHVRNFTLDFDRTTKFFFYRFWNRVAVVLSSTILLVVSMLMTWTRYWRMAFYE